MDTILGLPSSHPFSLGLILMLSLTNEHENKCTGMCGVYISPQVSANLNAV